MSDIYAYSTFPILNKSAAHLIPLPLEYVRSITISKAYSYLWAALNGQYPQQLPNNAQVNKAIETKYLAQGHKHILLAGLQLTV